MSATGSDEVMEEVLDLMLVHPALPTRLSGDDNVVCVILDCGASMRGACHRREAQRAGWCERDLSLHLRPRLASLRAQSCSPPRSPPQHLTASGWAGEGAGQRLELPLCPPRQLLACMLRNLTVVLQP
jgi:hypothetical protein